MLKPTTELNHDGIFSHNESTVHSGCNKIGKYGVIFAFLFITAITAYNNTISTNRYYSKLIIQATQSYIMLKMMLIVNG